MPVVDAGIGEGAVPLDDGTVLNGALAAAARVGGDLWCGETEAAEVVRRTVDAADPTAGCRESSTPSAPEAAVRNT
ncbi:MAG: hypothetical protein ACRDOK_16260 [Streptosporangiaceae bacterium]